MALTSMEQLFIEWPWYKHFLHNDNLHCVKCRNFTRKPCLSMKCPHHEIRWNYGILRCVTLFPVTSKSLSAKLSALLFSIFLWFFYWRFRVCSILTEKWNKKREIPWWSSYLHVNVQYLLFHWEEICLTSKISKINLADDNLIRKCV